jgi:hypothetical protein
MDPLTLADVFQSYASMKGYKSSVGLPGGGVEAPSWNDFKTTIGLGEEDPMSSYESAQRQYFDSFVIPNLQEKEVADQLWPEFQEMTKRKKKYSLLSEFIQKGYLETQNAIAETMKFLEPVTRMGFDPTGRNLTGDLPLRGEITAAQQGIQDESVAASQNLARETTAGPALGAAAGFSGQVVGNIPLALGMGGATFSKAPGAMGAIYRALQNGRNFGAFNAATSLADGKDLPEVANDAVRGAAFGVAAYPFQVGIESGFRSLANMSANRAAGRAAREDFWSDVKPSGETTKPPQPPGAPFIDIEGHVISPEPIRKQLTAGRKLLGPAPPDIDVPPSAQPPTPPYEGTVPLPKNPTEQLSLFKEYQDGVGTVFGIPEKTIPLNIPQTRELNAQGIGFRVAMQDGSSVDIPRGLKPTQLKERVQEILGKGINVSAIQGSPASIERWNNAVEEVMRPADPVVLRAASPAAAKAIATQLKLDFGTSVIPIKDRVIVPAQPKSMPSLPSIAPALQPKQEEKSQEVTQENVEAAATKTPPSYVPLEVPKVAIQPGTPMLVMRYQLIQQDMQAGKIPTEKGQVALNQLVEPIRMKYPEWVEKLGLQSSTIEEPAPPKWGADPEETRKLSQAPIVGSWNLTPEQKLQQAKGMTAHPGYVVKGLDAAGYTADLERRDYAMVDPTLGMKSGGYVVGTSKKGLRVITMKEMLDGTIKPKQSIPLTATEELESKLVWGLVQAEGLAKRTTVATPEGEEIAFWRTEMGAAAMMSGDVTGQARGLGSAGKNLNLVGELKRELYTPRGEKGFVAIERGSGVLTVGHEDGHLNIGMNPSIADELDFFTDRTIEDFEHYIEQGSSPFDAMMKLQASQGNFFSKMVKSETWNTFKDLEKALLDLGYPAYHVPEEVAIGIFAAIKYARVDPEAFRDLTWYVKKDESFGKVLDLARTISTWMLQKTQTGPDNYWSRRLQRYLKGVQLQTDPSAMIRRYAEMLQGPVELRMSPDPQGGNPRFEIYNVEEGTTEPFNTIEDMIKHVESDSEPILADTITMPFEAERMVARYPIDSMTSDGVGPSGGKPTSGDIFFSFSPGRREFFTQALDVIKGHGLPVPVKQPEPKPQHPGATLLLSSVRAFKDWTMSAETRTNVPVYTKAFLPIDNSRLAIDQYLTPWSEAMPKIIQSSTAEKRFAYCDYLQAKGIAAKEAVAAANHFTDQDRTNLRILRRFYDMAFGDFDVAMKANYIEDYEPWIIAWLKYNQSGKDPSTNPYKDDERVKKAIEFFAKRWRMKDYEEAGLQRDAVVKLDMYLRAGAKEKFMGQAWKEALKVYQDPRLTPEMRRPIGRYMKMMYGYPDHTEIALQQAWEHVQEKFPSLVKEGFDDTLINRLILFQYAGSLGYRPALVLRDMLSAVMQVLPHMPAANFVHGVKESLKETRWAQAKQYGALVPEKVGGVFHGDEIRESAMQPNTLGEALGKTGDTLTNFANAGLFLTSWGNNWARAVAFSATYDRAVPAVQKLRAKFAKGEKKFDRVEAIEDFATESGAEIFNPLLLKHIVQGVALNNQIKPEDVAGYLARHYVETTLFPFRKGNAPQIISTKMGRIFGMYGQWPVHFWEYIARSMKYGSLRHRAAWAAKFTGVNLVAHGLFKGMGLDQTNWLYMMPGEWTGSSFTQAALDLSPAAVNFSNQRGTEARGRMINFALGFIPGFQEFRGILRAMDSPNPIATILGFRTEKQEKGKWGSMRSMKLEMEKPELDEIGFYSRLQLSLKSVPERGVKASTLKAILSAGLVSKIEMDETGMAQWLMEKGNQTVGRDELLKYYDEHAIRVREVVRERQTMTKEEQDHLADLVVRRDELTRQAKEILPEGGEELIGDYSEDLESVATYADIRAYIDAMDDVPELTARQVFKLVDLVNQYNATIRDTINSEKANGAVKYGGSSLNLPGGDSESYKELIITLQNPEPPFEFNSSHWSEKNVLVHTRFDTVTDPKTLKRTLRLQEVQSDWHQQGRERGYSTSSKRYKVIQVGDRWGLEDPEHPDAELPDTYATEEAAERDAVAAYSDNWGGPVPNAPFKEQSEYTALALKRMIRYAVERDYDAIAWTTGAQQSARYGKLIEQVKVTDEQFDKVWDQGAYDRHEGNPRGYKQERTRIYINGVNTMIDRQALKDNYLGGNEELTEQVWNTPVGETVKLDKPFADKGMTNAYDEVINNIMKKIGKQYGLEVEFGSYSGIEIPKESASVSGTSFFNKEGEVVTPAPPTWYIDLNQPLKQAVRERGFPLAKKTLNK